MFISYVQLLQAVSPALLLHLLSAIRGLWPHLRMANFLTTSQAKTDGMAPNKEFFRLFVTATGSGADLLF
jgi:hypothetical protein